MWKRGLLFAAVALGGSMRASAQLVPAQVAAPAGFNWGRVEALPIASLLHVNARTRHSVCRLTAADAETLACDADTGVGTKHLSFRREEIKSVKLARRGRSAVLGAGILAGTGALVGGVHGIGNNYFAVRGAFAMIGVFAGAFAGAPVGYLTDFSGSTVYRAGHP